MDKWLWSVRLYKTRGDAAKACTAGKVAIGGQTVKASRSVRAGDIIVAITGEITRTVRVVALIERRISAKLVSQYFEDLTPATEYSKPKEKYFPSFGFRPKGTGRPTKKERRSMQNYLSPS